ncbi:MAG: hypothetical protein C5B50_29660 [Verrucomicrobia bacterium]|nr:MAG: hypothetical protein C5B50_29660 [Verrucomicrobiota bacterium]
MTAPLAKKRSFLKRCRIYFRWMRIALWIVTLLVLGGLIYLNQVGLPGFLKRPLLDRLHARGVDLQFSRLRLRWYQGVVAENVRFGQANEPDSPQLTAAQVQVHLDTASLKRLRLQVDSLGLRQGRMVCPIDENAQRSRYLTITNIFTELRFPAGDEWALDNFNAAFVGATFHVSGIIRNASAIREWKALGTAQHAPGKLWRERMREVADYLERIHFATAPDFTLDVRGDARDVQSFKARLRITAPGADTPWGTFTGGRFTIRVLPGATNELSRADLSLEANDAQTPWGSVTNLHLTVHATSSEAKTDVVVCDLTLTAGRTRTEWTQVAAFKLNAHWIHSMTNPVPLRGDGILQCEAATTRWGDAATVQLSATANRQEPLPTNRMPEVPWAWMTNLEDLVVQGDCQLTGVRGLTNLSAPPAIRQVSCQAYWTAPDLKLTHLRAMLSDRPDKPELQASLALNLASRRLNATLESHADPGHLAPLLKPGTQQWLTQFSWVEPPALKAQASIVMPAWTNRHPDWRAEVQPTLQLAGEFNMPRGGAYRGVQIKAASSQFAYSNLTWHLPDLTVWLGEGQIRAEHIANERTREFYWNVVSTVSPDAIRPLLHSNQLRVLDLATFTEAPNIQAQAWGTSDDPERIGVSAHVEATNFLFRGQAISALQTDVAYTNQILRFTGPRIQRANSEHVSADGLLADFRAQAVYLTNGVSTTDPLAIARAIGPKVGRAIEPYRFIQPPAAHVYGVIPMRGEELADLHFDLDGGPFQWTKFKLPRVAGHLHWLGEELTLTNMDLDFYGGRGQGHARFEFQPGGSAGYSFALVATNVQLQALMSALSTNASKLEGSLRGTLVITNADTADTNHISGYGSLGLRDGLIWDIPLFGILSPVLDGLLPGLGSTRFNAATCTFNISNSVIHSDDLEMRSPALRLRYHGNVDFQQKVNARVEAELLRDMWGVGPLVSALFLPVTKLFEYKVTGTLAQPKKEPLVPVIPKIVLLPFQLPFHPLRTLKDLLPPGEPSRTNAPPTVGPKPQGP